MCWLHSLPLTPSLTYSRTHSHTHSLIIQVMWSKTDAFVRLVEDFSYDFGRTSQDFALADPLPAVVNKVNSLTGLGETSPAPAITNGGGGGGSAAASPTAVIEPASPPSSSAASEAAKQEEDLGEEEDEAAAANAVDKKSLLPAPEVVLARPTRMGITLNLTATLDFEEDPAAAAKAAKAARARGCAPLQPGSVSFGVSKGANCGPDEVLQVCQFV